MAPAAAPHARDLARDLARGPGIGPRILAATAGIVLVTLGAAGAVAWTGATHAADRAVAQGLARTRAQVTELLAGRERQLRGSATVFAQNPVFVARWEGRTGDDWHDRAVEAQQQAEATWAQVTDAEGVRLARSDDPAAEPEALGGTALVGAALAGETASGFGVAGDTALFQAVSVPVATPGGAPVGTLQLAVTVDSALAWRVRAATESEIVLFVLDSLDRPRVVATTVAARALDSALAAALAVPEDAAGAAGDSVPVRLTSAAGEELVGHLAALRTARGTPVGGFVVLRSRRAELAAFGALWRGIAASGVLGLLLATALAAFVARRIAAPVRALAAAARRAAAGDYAAPIPDAPGEVGTLAGALRTLLAELRDQQALVAALADAERTQRLTREEAALAAGGQATLPRGMPGVGGGAGGAAGGEEPRPGRVFAGRYEIVALLGEGGMGTVYKARDRELGELVAVKTLRRGAVEDDPTLLERFRDEIRLARRITHRAVVRTHDVGQAGGVRYITMEYVDGTSLASLVQSRGPLSPAVTLSIGKQLARALEAAHEQGVLHRDVKPQNLIVTGDGQLKVMDFGIARLAGAERGVTRSGTIVGTPAYMAPEQLGGEALDARADVWAAGVVLYECLTGAAPFRGGTAYEVIASVLADAPPPPHEARPGVPAALGAVVMRAMAKDRLARTPSAAALFAALEGAEDAVRRAEPRYPEPPGARAVR